MLKVLNVSHNVVQLFILLSCVYMDSHLSQVQQIVLFHQLLLPIYALSSYLIDSYHPPINTPGF